MRNEFIKILSEKDILAHENIDDATIEKLVKALENDVNIMGFNPERYYEDIGEEMNGYVKFQMFILAIQWIHFWATATNIKHNNSKANFNAWYDGRNEMSVVFCRDLYENEYYQEILDKYGSDIDYRKPDTERNAAEKTCADFMKMVNTRMHRTNVQTATSLMIYALTIECKKCMAIAKLKEWMLSKYGDRYYAMPLI